MQRVVRETYRWVRLTQDIPHPKFSWSCVARCLSLHWIGTSVLRDVLGWCNNSIVKHISSECFCPSPSTHDRFESVFCTSREFAHNRLTLDNSVLLDPIFRRQIHFLGCPETSRKSLCYQLWASAALWDRRQRSLLLFRTFLIFPSWNEVSLSNHFFCKTTYLISCGSRYETMRGKKRNTAATKALKDNNKKSK